MMENNFAVFIISHERSERVESYNTLIRGGYTGQVYIVIDDEDSQKYDYLNRFGERIVIFNKDDYINCDRIVQEQTRTSAVYARNAVEHIARKLELNSFAVLDDDIVSLRYRWPQDKVVKSLSVIGGLDDVFRWYTDYMIDTDIATLSFTQVMFYVGGVNNLEQRICDLRETYQIHIRNVSKPVDWSAIINEDIITELRTAKTGYIWWSIPYLVYDAVKMNDKSGGVKELYDEMLANKRAMLAVVSSPDCCKIGYSHGKIRILQDRKSSYPMIISSEYRK